MRYLLKVGKFGYYFYDSEMSLDLSLKTVLNRLNDTNELLGKLRIKYNNLNIEILELNRIIHKINTENKK